MAISSTDIKMYASSSADSIGGAISATEIVSGQLNALFDMVTKDESRDGLIAHRCVYIKNINGTDSLLEALAYLTTNTASTDTEMAIGLGISGKNGTEQELTAETDIPTGISFTESVGSEFGLSLGDLAPNDSIGIWLRLTVNTGTTTAGNDGAIVRVDGSRVS